MNSTFNKAIAAALAGGLVAAASYLAPVIDDGLVASEILWAFVAALVGSGVTGYPTFKIRNAPEPSPHTSTPEVPPHA